jgi:hypothetical protein
MKVTSMGYDPDLGRKFSEESNGLVIGRRKSSPTVSDEELEDQEMAFQAQVEQDWIEEHGRAPDAQQLHDAINLARSPAPTTPASSAAPSGTSRLPPAPTRENFHSQEEFEEAQGYWQGHVGRIRGLVDLAARSKGSKPG